MGKLLERLRRGREKLKTRVSAFREKREIKRAIAVQKFEQRKKEKETEFEEKAEKIIKKQKRIAEVRESQLRRERAESRILQARATKFRSQRVIIGKGINLRIGGPIIQPRKAMAIPIKKKKKIKLRPIQQPTPGLGRFRVI